MQSQDDKIHIPESRKQYECRIHRKYDPQIRIRLQCSECLAIFSSVFEINNHLNTAHEYLNIRSQVLCFNTEEEFSTWKTTIETQTTSTYVITSFYRTKDYFLKLYNCHHSGSAGNHHTKYEGSNKTGYFCPASIKVKSFFEKNKSIEVTFIETHVGHMCEVKQRISFEKSSLACLVQVGVSKQKVGNISENSISSKNTNMQNFDNLSTFHELRTEKIKHQKEVSSVDYWIQERITSESFRKLLKMQAKSAAKQMQKQENSVESLEKEMQSQADEIPSKGREIQSNETKEMQTIETSIMQSSKGDEMESSEADKMESSEADEMESVEADEMESIEADEMKSSEVDKMESCDAIKIESRETDEIQNETEEMQSSEAGEMQSLVEEIQCQRSDMQHQNQEIQSQNEELINQCDKIQSQVLRNQFQCRVCDKYFNYNTNRRKHEKRMHKYYPQSRLGLQCSECLAIFSNVSEINNHLNTSHEYLNIKSQVLYFKTMEEFSTWKTIIETQTISTYVAATSYRTKYYFLKVYNCHRNGNFQSKSTGKRHIKYVGSNKTGFFCPSLIKVKTFSDKNKFIEVTYIETHVGHECEVIRQRISYHEKSAIAHLMQEGVPKENIIRKMCENTTPSKKIPNRQDLFNISVSFRLQNEIIRDENDVLSVDGCVQ